VKDEKQSATKRPQWARYAVALASVIVGWLAREGLTPSVGPTALPFITFFPAVAIAAWYGGFGPGLVALLLAAVTANWFFVEPVNSWALRTFSDVVTMAAFLVAGGFIIAAIDAMHRARGHLTGEIGERQRAQASLAQEKELLAVTLASIGDGVITTDAQGCITFLNSEAERLTGWTTVAAAGRPLPDVFRIINEQTRQPTENPVTKVFRTGKVAGLANHTILIARDDTEIPIDDSAAPIRRPDGSLSGVVLVFRDVTEDRKAQHAHARLAAIVEFSGDAIFTKNLDGIIQTWNASAERLFGYRPEEVIGKPVTILFPPDRLSEEDHILGSLRQGRPCERLETIRVARSGRRIPVLLSVSPLKDAEGNVIGASKVVHDITDLVAAREALVREKELLSTTLASIGDAVIVTDAEGRVTFLNSEAERLTAWKKAEAAGQPLPSVFRIINEHTRQPVENPVEKVLRLGSVVGLANHTVLISKDGRETPIDDSGAPIRVPGSPLFGVVLVFRDFTERRLTEDALRQAHEQLASRAVHLEELVQQRTAKLQETVAELESWSYSIAHDMRAPLRGMQSFATLLGQEHSQDFSAQGKDYIRRIIISAERMDRLIRDVLTYSRVVRSDVRLEPVHLHALLTGILDSYPAFQKPQAEITVDGQLPDVLGNEAALTQCISNLLGNAVKFVAPGVTPKVRIWAEQRPSTLSMADSSVRVFFQDNGIGIPETARGLIFGIFQRVSKDYEGTGIGLSIVKKAVQRMDGDVGYTSEVGKGSTFWVELRAVAPEPGK